MAEFADLTFGSLAYDPFGTAAPQIDFPPEQEELPYRPAEPAAPAAPAAPSPERHAAPGERVRVRTEADAGVRSVSRVRVGLYVLFTVPAVVVCLAMIVMLLRTHIRLTEVSNEAARLESRIAELRAEHTRLEIECESAFRMEEVEQTARSSIGMIKAEPDQAIYLRSTSEDLAVILGNSREETLAERIDVFLNRVLAYFSRISA